ncbi:hypothetical protein BUALT_Bualt04G0080300 [Buddleja alternifolia]|uniref:Vacuolar protein sorting-associated protein 52 A n=1 Tax=Buddleja alternifolia TaxID=168488 RepID=A0AAV6XYE9_9LAMI|nr:hypothetical protein BUALT_Bualt04G0080300 [Buddleja alternifolia]
MADEQPQRSLGSRRETPIFYTGEGEADVIEEQAEDDEGNIEEMENEMDEPWPVVIFPNNEIRKMVAPYWRALVVKSTPTDEASPTTYGPWNLVQPRTRRPNQRNLADGVEMGKATDTHFIFGKDNVAKDRDTSDLINPHKYGNMTNTKGGKNSTQYKRKEAVGNQSAQGSRFSTLHGMEDDIGHEEEGHPLNRNQAKQFNAGPKGLYRGQGMSCMAAGTSASVATLTVGVGLGGVADETTGFKKMTEASSNQPAEANYGPRTVLDLGAFVGELAIEDDATSDDVSLEGLEQELQDCLNDDVVATILSKGTKLRDYTKDVENNLRQIELDSIEDYVKESDNLVSLHDQIHDCDTILSQMEKLLSGFQAEIGSISSDIKILQEKSMDMGLKLKNRKAAESKLARFVEDIIVPPRMIDIIVDGEVNEEFMRTLEILSKKLKFVEVDAMVKTSKALNDVQPELEKLRQKAVAKVFDFIVQKLNALRKPKTNVQILQQSVLLKYKYVILFLKEHGKEIYLEVRAAYIDTMNKLLAVLQVLSSKIRAYIQALEKLQLDIATSSDLIGVDTRSTSLFLRGREPLKNRSAVFALGERINILKDAVKEIDESALIPHIAEASSKKYPYEVLFRSLHKLLMDTAASEYLFCDEFFGEESMFYDIFAGPFSVIDEHLNTILPNCFDAIGLMLMIRIIYQHQLIMSRRRIPCLDSYLDKVNISLWPRFKMVFDMHLSSLRNANIRTLWEDDVHPHYVMRRYAEFTASLIQLNVDYGDGQLELNLERLRMAIDDLLVKLAKLFQKPKLQTVFLINNYDMTIAVLKEAGAEGGKIPMHFEELLKNNTAIYVEELLVEHFSDLIKFVKTRACTCDDSSSGSERPMTVAEVEPIVKDFASRWKAAIELMHNDVITSFSNFLCGMEILRAALTQLLLYYTRLSDCMKRIAGGSALNKDLVSISSIILHEQFYLVQYIRTFIVVEANDGPRSVLDLGAFVGKLDVEADATISSFFFSCSSVCVTPYV